MPTVQETPFDLPGLTLPLDFKPTRDAVAPFFANALDYDDIEFGFCGHIFTVRELYMMRIMEAVTDKPNWDTKVWNKEITDKWRSEILQGDLDVAEAMIDYIFRELEWKAPRPQEELRAAVKPLEDISDEEKDYHPGSDGKVVDLVHPSLIPLISGRTRVLRDKVIGIDNCFNSVGQGAVLKVDKKHGTFPHEHEPAEIATD